MGRADLVDEGAPRFGNQQVDGADSRIRPWRASDAVNREAARGQGRQHVATDEAGGAGDEDAAAHRFQSG